MPTTQTIAILVMILIIIIAVIWDVYKAVTNKKTVDRKTALTDIIEHLRDVHHNPLGVYKSSLNNIVSIDDVVIDKFAIGYIKSPKYGYDITTIYNYPDKSIEVTFSIPHVDGVFGSITRLTWNVKEGMLKSKYYLDHLYYQIRIWEEEFHEASQSGTDNETDR